MLDTSTIFGFSIRISWDAHNAAYSIVSLEGLPPFMCPGSIVLHPVYGLHPDPQGYDLHGRHRYASLAYRLS